MKLADMIIVLALASPCSMAADVVFIATENIPLGLGTTTSRFADVNNDGLPDLISVSNSVDSLNVLINLGPDEDDRINFEQVAVLRTGVEPRDLAPGDFNGDGDIDIAATSFEDDGISIFIGDGKGGFRLSTLLRTRSEPDRLEAADLNGDGLTDLVVNETDSTSVGVYLATTDGFETRTGFETAGNLAALALSDLEGDGDIDIFIGADRLQVMVNDGTGNFSRLQYLDLGRRIVDIAVHDLNNDNRADVVIAPDNHTIRLLLNNDTPSPFSDEDPEDSAYVDELNLGRAPARLKVSDVTRDGFVDIVYVDGESPGFALLEGTGYAKFIDLRTYQANLASPGISLDIADVDGDGRDDVQVTSPGSAHVFRGMNELHYDRFDTYPLGVTPTQIARARLDTDAYDDAIIRDSSQAAVYLMRSDGDQEFVLAGTLSLSSPAAAMIPVDIDGDGRDEIVVSESGSTNVDIYRAVGPANYVLDATIALGGRVGAVTAGEFDGVAGVDLAIADINNDVIHVFVSRAIDDWQPYLTTAMVSQPFLMKAGDVDRDGMDELALTYSTSPSIINVFRLSTDLQPISTLQGKRNASAIRFEDLDGDGYSDISAISEGESVFFVFRNDAGEFGSTAREYPTDLGPIDFHLDDIDEDGLIDVIVSSAYDKRIGILYQNGDGFEPHGNYITVPASPSAGSLADLNGDGRREVLLTLPSLSSFGIIGRSENEKPDAADLYFWLEDDEYYVEDFLSGIDVNNDDLQYTIEQLPKYGRVTLLDPSRGFFRYDTGPGFDERDTFTYRVNDGMEVSEEAVVRVEQEEDEGGGSISLMWLMLLYVAATRMTARQERSE